MVSSILVRALALEIKDLFNMKNPEYEKASGETDDGYSEKQLDLDAEIGAGEWEKLNKFRTYRRRSRQWKIIATHKAIANRVKQLEILFYKLCKDNPKKSERLLLELKRLRLLQEILLQCMVWEPKGELEKNMVPKEVWDLIK